MIQALNDSTLERTPRLWQTALALNVVSVLIAGYYGFSSLFAPEDRAGITGPRTDDLVMYASLYGIRSVVIAVVLLAVLLLDRRTGGQRLVPLLVLAGAVQAGDTVLLVATGSAAMAAGPLVSVIVHLATAVLLHRNASTASLSAVPAGR